VPSDPKNPCTISDYRIEDNVVTWTSECPKMKAKSKGKMTFDDDSYSGEIRMKVEEQEMTMKLAGQWKGACSK
jgi:hypothetical protein